VSRRHEALCAWGWRACDPCKRGSFGSFPSPSLTRGRATALHHGCGGTVPPRRARLPQQGTRAGPGPGWCRAARRAPQARAPAHRHATQAGWGAAKRRRRRAPSRERGGREGPTRARGNEQRCSAASSALRERAGFPSPQLAAGTKVGMQSVCIK